MKKHIGKIVQIAEIIINIALLPLLNVKFFRSSGVMPVGREDGKTVFKSVYNYHSIYDNLDAVAYISVLFIAIAVMFSLLSMINKKKKFIYLGHFLSVCSVLVFVILFFIASTVKYDF